VRVVLTVLAFFLLLTPPMLNGLIADTIRLPFSDATEFSDVRKQPPKKTQRVIHRSSSSTGGYVAPAVLIDKKNEDEEKRRKGLQGH
jgi:hypothetical protein